jgi:hypothetical protein
MGWKDLSYALRGFYLGLIITALGFLFTLVKFKLLYSCFTGSVKYCGIIFLLLFISCFAWLIGAIIGWIVGKVKAKKEEKK